jgi:DNA-binding transcriptional MerR regulator
VVAINWQPKEAATYLGVAKVTIDRLTKRSLLHPSRALRHPIYSKHDLDRLLRETQASRRAPIDKSGGWRNTGKSSRRK